MIISTYKPSWAVFRMINKSERDAFANYSQSVEERLCVRVEQANNKKKKKVPFSPESHNFLIFRNIS